MVEVVEGIEGNGASFRFVETSRDVGLSKLESDERLLEDSIDFGEWANARTSRAMGASHTPDQNSLFGQSMLWYITGLVRSGWNMSLEESDLPGLRKSYLSANLYSNFREQFKKRDVPGARFLFQRSLLAVPQIRRTLIIGAFFSSMQGLFATVGRPLVLKVVVNSVNEGVDLGSSIALILLFAFVVGMEGWSAALGRQLLAEEFGTQFQICASSAVYSKMLRVDTQRLQQDQSSEQSLIGNDVVRAYENLRTAANLPMALAGVTGGIIVLLALIGTPALVGIAIMGLIMLLNLALGKVAHSIEQRNLKAADRRLTLLGAVLDGIRAVKLFGWEEKYNERITETRNEECVHIRNYRLAHVSSIASGRASPVLAAMVTLVFYAVSEDELDIADAYAAVSIFQALRLGLIFVPLCATALMAFDVTMKRLNTYFKRPEKPEPVFIDTMNRSGDDKLLMARIKNADLGWDVQGPAVLKNVNLEVFGGEIVAIVGGVGLGKTTLLATVAQTIQPLQLNPGTPRGLVETVRSMAFAPQKPFVVCGTLKQNILLGRAYNEDRFNRVLFESGLASDVELFENGIQTEVGERGTTLSGGQQSRMAVARALYADPDLLFLDDPLAAVDSKTCAHMFTHAVLDRVCSSNGSKSCIIAMNQLSLLDQVDRIVFISNEGKVADQGRYDDLLQRCPEFEEFVRSTRIMDASTLDEDVDETLDHREHDSKEQHGKRVCSKIGEEKSKERSSSNPAQEVNITIMGSEVRTKGSITGNVYMTYLSSVGPFYMGFAISLCLGGYILMALNDYWLTFWSEALKDPNETRGDAFFAGVYASFSIFFGIAILIASWMLCFGGVKASKELHKNMLDKLLGAPLSWFESTSSGRIMSRFSGDLSKVDMILSLAVDNTIQIVCTLLVMLGVICYAVPFMVIVVTLVFVLFGFLIVAVDRASREVRRISNSNLSPLLSNASEATRGRDVVAVMGCGPFFEARHRLASDEYARANYAAGSLINFAQLATNYLSFVVSVSSATLLIFLKDNFETNLLALVLTYCFTLSYFAGTLSQILIRMNSFFTSFERLLEYEKLPQEVRVEHEDGDPSPDPEVWPSRGEITFENVEMRYRSGLPLALKGLSFTIKGGESVGICGKTGSGKSSTIATLFRLTNISSGRILLDDRDITSIDVGVLRDRITIIPQDPVLVSGTIATNLDPFDEHPRDQLQSALESVGMMERVNLDDLVEDSGRNWSAGERQLICFARALLRPNKVLVCDEPTSSIDTNTDSFIQDMLRQTFHEKRKNTLIVIAHRIQTIATFQKIIVMSDGRVAESGSPTYLLQDSSSEFHSMVSALGEGAQAHIKKLAKQSQALESASENNEN